MLYLVQRIHKGAAPNGDDIRETLIVGCADADSALEKIKDYFDDDQEWVVSYNAMTKRFNVSPKGREELVYHIVKKADEELIDEVAEDAGNTSQE